MIFWVKPVVVDTLEITLGLGSKSAYDALKSDLIQWAKKSSSKVVTLRFRDYGVDLRYWAPKKGAVASVEIGITKSKHRYARVSLQIGALDAGVFKAFQVALKENIPALAYGKIFALANVSRVDFAVDVVGYEAHELIPYRPYTACSHFHLRKDGTRGTLYLGSTTSKVRVRVYDRKRKLKRKGISVAFSKVTRIEIQTRRLGIAASKFPFALANPFANLIIADRDKARGLSDSSWWQKFLDVAEHVGSAKALTMLPKYQRTLARENLKVASATWWNPESVWMGASQAVKDIQPMSEAH